VDLRPQQIVVVSLSRAKPQTPWGLKLEQRSSGGCRIMSVTENSPAACWNSAVAKLELPHYAMRKDDVILSMNGRDFDTTAFEHFKSEVTCATLVICRDD